MSRLRDLGADELPRLPDSCRTCTFWESRSAPRGPSASADSKIAWWQATQLEWGPPGKGVFLEDECVGYVVAVPSGLVPRTRTLGPAASDDALLLTALWVAPHAREGGLARALFQASVRTAHQAGLKAVEAYGIEGEVTESRCVPPAAVLRSLGLSLHRPHASFPLYRVEVRSSVAWAAVGQALEGVVTALARRERQPLPEPG